MPGHVTEDILVSVTECFLSLEITIILFRGGDLNGF